MNETAVRTAEIEGLVVQYRDVGHGSPVIFLHGAGGAPPDGALFVSMLARRHRLIIPSRPGFDQTPLGECSSGPSETRVMAAFIQSVAGGKAHVVAQSAGCATGCWLAILFPELVSRLVLSAPSAFALHRGPPPSPQELEHILYGDQPAWSAPPSAAERQRIGGNAAGNMGRWRAADADALKERLAEIATPTLLLWGDGDRLVPEIALQPYRDLLPHLEYVVIPGAAHELPIAAASPWVQRVTGFIDRPDTFSQE